jgi:hypothetical protein
MKLHLASDPLAVKVRIPPSTFVLPRRVTVAARYIPCSIPLTPGSCDQPSSPRLRPHKRDAEEPVLTRRDNRLPHCGAIITMPSGTRRGLLHDNGGRARVLIKGRVFLLVLCLPGVVDLEKGEKYILIFFYRKPNFPKMKKKTLG